MKQMPTLSTLQLQLPSRRELFRISNLKKIKRMKDTPPMRASLVVMIQTFWDRTRACSKLT
jgi:hypothetical protein